MTDLDKAREEWEAADMGRDLGMHSARRAAAKADALIAALTARVEELEEVEAALDELDSYNGHLAWMDKHYPLDVPYFSESEDVGCQVMRLSRKVMEQATALAQAEATLAAERERRCDKCEYYEDAFCLHPDNMVYPLTSEGGFNFVPEPDFWCAYWQGKGGDHA